MTRHLVRLIWNRKRQNFLLAAEIFFSFLVLLGVLLMAVGFLHNWRHPLGYTIDRVWSVEVDRKETDRDPAVKARHRETFRRLLAEIATLPEVEAAAAGFTAPYSGMSWGQNLDLEGGREVQFGINTVTEDYRDVLGLKVVDGRWFSRDDAAATWVPVVLNQRMAREVFGGAPAVGRAIPLENTAGKPPLRERRVVGVIEDFRKDGELSRPGNFGFFRMDLEHGEPARDLPAAIVIRVAPGTTAAFEETLVERLQAVARDWSFEARTLESMREDAMRKYTTPLYAIGTVAVFLLLMVALGLTGVVWQSVTQRTREFGLRRAKGATIPDVRRQVLSELVIMTSLALAVGVALVVQLPWLPLHEDLMVPPGVFVTSVAVSVATIYLLTLLCAWYPSRLATKIQPAEALHYE